MEALNQDCKTVTLVLPFNVEEKNHFSKTSTKMGSEANHSMLYTRSGRLSGEFYFQFQSLF
jgi:hypothetical protein